MKVIVVDDEKWVRTTIISQIPFDTLGLTLCCEASNGIEALELCRQYEPEILITDIKMPGLSGLELIAEVKSLIPQTRIIIISGYDDFEYARTAFKHGVSDYILKPIDKNEMINILTKVKDSIMQEKLLLEQQAYIVKQYKLALPIIGEQFLNQLTIPNTMTVNNIAIELSKYNISFNYPLYIMVVFSGESFKLLSSKVNFNYFKAFALKLMKKYFGALTFSSNRNAFELISIINYKSDIDYGTLQKVLLLCSKFYKRRFNRNLYIGISLSERELNKLDMLYNQTQEALLLKFWEPDRIVYYYEKDQLSDNVALNICERTLEDILFNIKLKNYEPANNFIDSTCQKLRSGKYVNPDIVRRFFGNFIYTLSLKLNIYKSFIDYESIFANAQPYERINSISTLDSLISYLKELIQHMGEHYADINPSNETSVIESVKKIMVQNYFKDFSLEQMSKYVNLNPTYFSELFKKETGMSFVYYKTMLRIDKAKKLLQSTDMNINMISEKIGYSDHKYFSKIFKKITGMTVSEYKKSVKKI